MVQSGKERFEISTKLSGRPDHTAFLHSKINPTNRNKNMLPLTMPYTTVETVQGIMSNLTPMIVPAVRRVL